MSKHKKKDSDPKMPKPKKKKPETPPEIQEEKAPDLFPDNVAPQKDNPTPPADDCKPEEEAHCEPEEKRPQFTLPLHPDWEEPAEDKIDVVHNPIVPPPGPPLANPVKLSRCPVAVWQMPWGRYVVLAAPPGDDEALDELRDGQFVDVDLHPAVSIEENE